MANPTEIAALEIRITGVEKAISQFGSFQQTTTKTMSASEAAVTRSLKNMASQFVGVAAVARSVQNVISSGIGFNQFVENTTMSFTVMMKSAEKAKTQMKDLYDFAVNSPLTFKETAASSKQLMAYGFAAEELIPTMKTLGTVALATGHSLDDISYVYGTLKSQGRAYSRDLMQFGMRGIPIYEELAKVMGVDVKMIQKMASEGKIGFGEVEKAFKNMTTNGGRFAGTIEGYMTTLTGKLSQLSDIAQQSAGTLMSGVTDSLKGFITSLTDTLKSSGAQRYISDLGNDLRILSNVLLSMTNVLIKILPLLTAFLKIWVAFKVISSIPTLMYRIGDAAIGAAVKVASLNTALATTSAASLSTALASAVTGVKLLSGALKALIVSNPWLLVIAAIAGTVITIKHTYETTQERQKDDAFASERIAASYKSGISTKDISTDKDTLEFIKMEADMYERSAIVVAGMLYNQRLISREVANQAGYYTKEQADAMFKPTNISKTVEEVQEEFLAQMNNAYKTVWDEKTKTATKVLDVEKYRKPEGDKTEGAMGGKAAAEYLAAVQKRFDDTKLSWDGAYDEQAAQANATQAIADIQNAINAGKNIEGLFNGTYDEVMEAGKKAFQKLLQDTGSGIAKLAPVIKQLGKWWLPEESQVAATTSAVDDAQLAAEKAVFNANAEAYAREDIVKQNMDIVKGMQDGLVKTKLQKQYTQELTDLEDKRKGIILDIGVSSKRTIDALKYQEALSGKSGYWEGVQAQAGAAIEKANSKDLSFGERAGARLEATGATVKSSMQGTEVGAMMTGDPITIAIAALMSLAKEVENVGKILNPFSTMFEFMSVSLAMLNDAFAPIVGVLEMFGGILDNMLPLFIGIYRTIQAWLYPYIMIVVAALQILGEGFRRLYDWYIVPFGNAIIDMANGFVRAINKVFGKFGVHLNELDKLKTTGEYIKLLNENIAELVKNMQTNLGATISYLSKGINDLVDNQIKSLQNLYEVGAISGASYDEQVKALNAQKISGDNGVAIADKQLSTQGSMLERLYELVQLQQTLNDKSLTDEDKKELLSGKGILSSDDTTALVAAVLAALNASGGTAGSGTDTYTGNDKIYADIDAAKDAMASAKAAMEKIIEQGQTLAAIYHANGLNVNLQKLVSDATKSYTDSEAAYNALLASASAAGIDVSAYTETPMGNNMNYSASLRSGEGTTKSYEGSGQVTNINVTVQGSVTSEDDLATTIAERIYIRRKTGLLTV